MLQLIGSYLGYIAGFLTTIAFLPQVFKVWTTKSTKDISIWMFLAFITGVFLWMIYGFLINDTSIIITNILTFTLALTILIAKIKFK